MSSLRSPLTTSILHRGGPPRALWAFILTVVFLTAVTSVAMGGSLAGSIGPNDFLDPGAVALVIILIPYRLFTALTVYQLRRFGIGLLVGEAVLSMFTLTAGQVLFFPALCLTRAACMPLAGDGRVLLIVLALNVALALAYRDLCRRLRGGQADS